MAFHADADIIAKGWEENHWDRPTITEQSIQPEYTELILDLLKEGGQTGGQKSGQSITEKTTEKTIYRPSLDNLKIVTWRKHNL